MKYNVHLEFSRYVHNIEASSKKDAYINALHAITNAPKIQCETLFEEMIKAKMNYSRAEEING